VDTQSLILDEWCAFSFLRARRFIAGEIEIPQSVSMPKWSAYSWFNSLRENFAERTVPAYYGTSRSTVSEWVEPSPQDRLSLFPSGTGSLEIADPSGGPTAPEHRYPFTVSPNQRTLVFPSHPDLRLLLDTRNGRFTGVFTGTIRDPAANGGTRFVSRGAIRGVLFSPPGAPPDASGLPEAPSKLEGDPTLSAGVGQLLTPVGTFQVNLLRGN
jgi:hypothetical protein